MMPLEPPELPKGNKAGDIAQLQAYLVRLAEYLNITLSELDARLENVNKEVT